jgi:hypothetical protein
VIRYFWEGEESYIGFERSGFKFESEIVLSEVRRLPFSHTGLRAVPTYDLLNKTLR